MDVDAGWTSRGGEEVSSCPFCNPSFSDVQDIWSVVSP